MEKIIFPKQAALIFGVLVLSFVIAFYAIAWTEPVSAPPAGVIDTPLNSGSIPQTKTSNLTLPNLYLNALGNEGSIYNADVVQGYNDIFIRSNSAENAPIYLGGSQISAYTSGSERLRINSSGSVGIGDSSPAALLTVGNGDLFRIDSSGNLIRIRNIAYSWPGVQGTVSTYLKNDGSGNLTWAAQGAGGVMYLRNRFDSGNPANCPSGWLEADNKSEYASGRINIVRTCYRTNLSCQVMYLRNRLDSGNPANCPSGWLEADNKSEYAGDGINIVRTCYLCY